MKPTRVLILTLLIPALFALASCGDAPLEKLNGSWVISLDDTINASPAMKSSIPEGEAGKMARGMLEDMLGKMTLTFDIKAKTISGNILGEKLDKIPFEVVKESGDTLELKIKDQTSIVTIKGATLEMGDSDEKLIFKRQ